MLLLTTTRTFTLVQYATLLLNASSIYLQIKGTDYSTVYSPLLNNNALITVNMLLQFCLRLLVL